MEMNMEQSYENAYMLMIGAKDYKELGKEFYLPKDHEDPDMLIKYYEEQEEYEKCNQIIKARQ
tara:strand:+ start:2055 stop:2243 length:189 start_codon:yes stop_codon:yes gene_type:complete